MQLYQKTGNIKRVDLYLFLDALISETDKEELVDTEPSKKGKEVCSKPQAAPERAKFLQATCFPHAGLFARWAASLQTTRQGENHETLVEHIFGAWKHWKDGSLKSFQAQEFTQFKKAVNPDHPERLLGPDRYPRPPVKWKQMFPDAKREELFDDVAGSPGAWDTYNSDTTINLGSFFAELRDDRELIHILHTEFDMFLYHAREEVDGKRVVGWGKNMFFSLSQQLLTQDLRLNILWYLSRRDSDKLHGWLNVPYYTRNCKAGDRFEFIHIDNNIRDLIYRGSGIDGIQIFISLDGEDKFNCTYGTKRLQLRDDNGKTTLEDVYQWIISTSPDLLHPDHSETVTNLSKVWPSAVAKFGSDIELKALPNETMGLRLSKPEMVHGTRVPGGEKSKRRRGMAVWFTGVFPDEDGCDNPGPPLNTATEAPDLGGQLGTAKAQKRRKPINAGRRKEEGRGGDCAGTPEPNPPPALVQRVSPEAMQGSGYLYASPSNFTSPPVTAIGGMVVCTVDRADPAIQHELRVALGEDRRAASELFLQSRRESIAMVKRYWPIIEQAERDLYGANSYFLNKGSF
ncbi:hypothetical protein N431DRAFT_475930 [Stipitochalara longipes BDJ]|nr:hypothetical protein N431DRAFT_475930 [Stipitochalara longipes BDJ]